MICERLRADGVDAFDRATSPWGEASSIPSTLPTRPRSTFTSAISNAPRSTSRSNGARLRQRSGMTPERDYDPAIDDDLTWAAEDLAQARRAFERVRETSEPADTRWERNGFRWRLIARATHLPDGRPDAYLTATDKRSH